MARSSRRRQRTIELRAQPTAERMKQSSGAFEIGNATGGLTFINQLERAARRRIITEGQYNAGQKFHGHWHRSGLDPLRAFDPSFSGGGRHDFSFLAQNERQCHDRDQLRLAIRELGPSVDLVVRVVCLGNGYEAAEKSRFGDIIGFGTKPQSITAAQRELQLGLERLRIMWGL